MKDEQDESRDVDELIDEWEAEASQVVEVSPPGPLTERESIEHARGVLMEALDRPGSARRKEELLIAIEGLLDEAEEVGASGTIWDVVPEDPPLEVLAESLADYLVSEGQLDPSRVRGLLEELGREYSRHGYARGDIRSRYPPLAEPEVEAEGEELAESLAGKLEGLRRGALETLGTSENPDELLAAHRMRQRLGQGRFKSRSRGADFSVMWGSITFLTRQNIESLILASESWLSRSSGIDDRTAVREASESFLSQLGMERAVNAWRREHHDWRTPGQELEDRYKGGTLGSYMSQWSVHAEPPPEVEEPGERPEAPLPTGDGRVEYMETGESPEDKGMKHGVMVQGGRVSTEPDEAALGEWTLADGSIRDESGHLRKRRDSIWW